MFRAWPIRNERERRRRRRKRGRDCRWKRRREGDKPNLKPKKNVPASKRSGVGKKKHVDCGIWNVGRLRMRSVDGKKRSAHGD
jgi:hypothetical protein